METVAAMEVGDVTSSSMGVTLGREVRWPSLDVLRAVAKTWRFCFWTGKVLNQSSRSERNTTLSEIETRK